MFLCNLFLFIIDNKFTMTNTSLYKLNEQQKKLCYYFIQKWQKTLFSTQPVNQENAKQAIHEAYQILNLPKPKIIFCQRDYDIFHFISIADLIPDNYINLYSDLVEKLLESFSLGDIILQTYLENPGLSSSFFELNDSFENICYEVFKTIYDNECKIGTDYYFTELLKVEFSDIDCCEYDFFIEGLKYDCNQAIWYILKSLAQKCPYLISLQNTCFFINRPSSLNFYETLANFNSI